MRISPSNIQKLKPNEIIVFGSNSKGFHYGGLARICHEKFGAMWGKAEGMQGQCYAIDTMNGLYSINEQVQYFIYFAKSNKSLKFLVTLIGTGIAKYKVEDIAPMFKSALNTRNIYLPKEFYNHLTQNP